MTHLKTPLHPPPARSKTDALILNGTTDLHKLFPLVSEVFLYLFCLSCLLFGMLLNVFHSFYEQSTELCLQPLAQNFFFMHLLLMLQIKKRFFFFCLYSVETMQTLISKLGSPASRYEAILRRLAEDLACSRRNQREKRQVKERMDEFLY